MTDTDPESSSEPSAFPAEIATERLIFRRFRESDAVAVTTILQDRDVTRWLSSVPWPYPDGAATEHIAANCSPEAESRVVNRAITLDGVFIGSVGLTRHVDHQRAYLGYYLGQPWWGHGYMSEAAAAMIQLAFEHLNCVRVDSSCFATNAGSANVLRKLGFREEGLRRKMYFRMNQWNDEAIFGLLREEWSDT